jgi:hypothetical protein
MASSEKNMSRMRERHQKAERSASRIVRRVRGKNERPYRLFETSGIPLEAPLASADGSNPPVKMAQSRRVVFPSEAVQGEKTEEV